jgi:hypothetical protein
MKPTGIFVEILTGVLCSVQGREDSRRKHDALRGEALFLQSCQTKLYVNGSSDYSPFLEEPKGQVEAHL